MPGTRRLESIGDITAQAAPADPAYFGPTSTLLLAIRGAKGLLEAYPREKLIIGRSAPQLTQRINIDLAVEDAAVIEDRLDSVVDYEAITAKIRALIATGHINLAETLAERIAQACFDDPRVRSARVRVEKLHALPGAESAGVEIERTRAD